MEWWGLIAGVAIGLALAGLMAWRGRAVLRRRQAEGIQDAATFGWMKLDVPRGDDPGDNANENRS
ncbi:hypothetical protein AB0O90_16010 [Microbacterium testaceum]|uniref:hypothetical protein n=1 Tax=Microbacterium testaceum TaxID=2033 RepID=UPI00341AE6CF